MSKTNKVTLQDVEQARKYRLPKEEKEALIARGSAIPVADPLVLRNVFYFPGDELCLSGDFLDGLEPQNRTKFIDIFTKGGCFYIDVDGYVCMYAVYEHIRMIQKWQSIDTFPPEERREMMIGIGIAPENIVFARDCAPAMRQAYEKMCGHPVSDSEIILLGRQNAQLMVKHMAMLMGNEKGPYPMKLLQVQRDPGCRVCHKADRKPRRCGGCHIAAYCSTACQAKDWPEHKKQCEEMRHDVERYEQKKGEKETQEEKIS